MSLGGTADTPLPRTRPAPLSWGANCVRFAASGSGSRSVPEPEVLADPTRSGRARATARRGPDQRTRTDRRLAQVDPAAFATETDIQYRVPRVRPLMVQERCLGPAVHVPATAAPRALLLSACTW